MGFLFLWTLRPGPIFSSIFVGIYRVHTFHRDFHRLLKHVYALFCIELRTSIVAFFFGVPKNPPAKAELPPRPTHPPDERPHSVSRPNPDDTARWLALADIALRQAPTQEDVAEMEALARKEQVAIKKRIRRTAELVKRQSKSKQ